MSDEKSFSKRINEELRSSRGQVVDGYRMPPEHEAINRFLREGAGRNTWETDLSGRTTHVNGEPVEDRGGRGALVARCPGLTRSGDQCSASVPPGAEWCYNHDPARQDERRRNASKAGKSGGNREVSDLKKQLSDLYEATLAGEVDRSVAAVLAQICNARTRLLETERRIKETEELEERIRQMEEMIA